jgi:hypothetical protein
MTQELDRATDRLLDLLEQFDSTGNRDLLPEIRVAWRNWFHVFSLIRTGLRSELAQVYAKVTFRLPAPKGSPT